MQNTSTIMLKINCEQITTEVQKKATERPLLGWVGGKVGKEHT
jgi:hypothetical protein